MDEPRGTDPTNLGNPIAARRALPEEWCGDHFAAPLGSSTSGRLRFINGAHRVVIRADAHVRGLYRARFGDRMPTIWVHGGAVTIRYPQVAACDWLNCRSERPAEVALNALIPWDVEVRGGASRFVADLRGLRGGASNVAIPRPAGVAARLCVGGGATLLKFDDRRIGAAGGELDLRDRDYDGAIGRYDVAVTGGANNLSIDKQRGWKEGVDLDREGE
ncbi:MAG: hypothetical protein LC781_19630 [Actinobacteria bacterium]|nr:hypothetical protein [Actinomycetota bacterium]